MMTAEAPAAGLAPSGVDLEAGIRSRRRRRSLTWLAFGLVGLIMGAVWAVGIATSTATVNTPGAAATQVFGTAPGTAPASAYDTLVTANTALIIDFTGTWGSIAVDAEMFDVDLTLETGTYFVAIYLNNNATGWSVLQLEFRQVDMTCAAAGPTDWDSPAATSVMVIETEDAWAVFPGLASGGGADYCFGIRDITPKANDTAGTYIRRPTPSASPTAPIFVAMLGRSA